VYFSKFHQIKDKTNTVEIQIGSNHINIAVKMRVKRKQ